MPGFLIDEDLPRSLAPELRAAGLDAQDVRDIGLRGTPDDVVLGSARSANRILVTGDLGFANLLRYPLGSHAGVVVARCPNELPTVTLNTAIIEALRQVPGNDLPGNLLIIEPGRLRLRREHRPNAG